MPKSLDASQRQAIGEAFAAAVNMTPVELGSWLETAQSLSVGFKRRGESESVGHRAGRRILAILALHPAELEDDDYRLMRKAVGYVKRHRAQRPAGDVSATRWRYSLMNWGHDPLSEG